MPTFEEISKAIKSAGMAAEDKLPGGRADQYSEADFDAKKLEKGIAHELEHTNDPEIAKEIAMDHLAEDPDYYEKLEKIGLEKPEIDKTLLSKYHPISLTRLSAEKSEGHIGFYKNDYGKFELFNFEGKIYKAPIDAPVSIVKPKVRSSGRFEAPISQLEYTLKKLNAEKINP